VNCETEHTSWNTKFLIECRFADRYFKGRVHQARKFQSGQVLINRDYRHVGIVGYQNTSSGKYCKLTGQLREGGVLIGSEEKRLALVQDGGLRFESGRAYRYPQ